MTPRPLTLQPGDLIAALHPMRAWESHWYRGDHGDVIYPGFTGLVMAVMFIGRVRESVRFDVLALDKIFIFSSSLENLKYNWQLLTPR